jgi:hypothetical protein
MIDEAFEQILVVSLSGRTTNAHSSPYYYGIAAPLLCCHHPLARTGGGTPATIEIASLPETGSGEHTYGERDRRPADYIREHCCLGQRLVRDEIVCPSSKFR